MRLLKILLVLGVVASLSACDLFERRDRTFDDDPKLEFVPLTQTIDESDVASAGGSVTVTPEIQLIGPQRESDLSVNFTVADSSTAEQGTHYTLPSTSATISSGSSQTEVAVNVLDNDQDDGGTTHVLFLNIQGSDGGVAPAENLRTYTLNIRGADE